MNHCSGTCPNPQENGVSVTKKRKHKSHGENIRAGPHPAPNAPNTGRTPDKGESPPQPKPDTKVSMSNTYAASTPPKSKSKRNSTKQIPSADLKRLRACPDRTTRTLVVAAAKAGIRYRMMQNGIIFYGNNGQAITVHFTDSDRRASQNTRARFKQIGFEA